MYLFDFVYFIGVLGRTKEYFPSTKAARIMTAGNLAVTVGTSTTICRLLRTFPVSVQTG